jgi:hypothetical protein
MRRKIKERIRKRQYRAEDAEDQSFTAYIIRGNRQVVRREVVATKRFKVDDDTYVIKPQCIFLKNIDGTLQSVSYYREGNPNPYDFKDENIGLKADELDRIFAEDFFHIITDLQLESKAIYLLLIVLINLGLIIAITVKTLMGVF